MKNIDKFYQIWIDLDASYDKLKDSLKVNNKNEFLKKLCYTNNGGSLIQQIKVLLKNESPSYTSEESVKYTDLITILDAVELFISNNDLNSVTITNLKALTYELITNRNDAFSEKIITADEINHSFTYKPNTLKLSSKEMFQTYGELSSFCKTYYGKIVSCELREDFRNDFVILNSDTLKSLEKFKYKKTPFLETSIKLYNLLLKSGLSSDVSIAFCDKSLLEGNKVLGRSIEVVADYAKFISASYKGYLINIV